MAEVKTIITVYDATNIGQMALDDLKEGLLRPQLWWHFAVHDIKLRFRRSTFGPLWITISTGIMVAALGFVFSQIFSQSIDDFLPYLATGLIFWGLMTSIINEGCVTFIVSEGYIKNVPMPLSVHYYRMFARNIIIWSLNMLIYLLVFLFFEQELSWAMLWFIPGFILFAATVFMFGLIAAILSTRFRDIPQIVGSVIQVIFFVTPIFWSLDNLPDRPAFIVLNPMFHLIEIVRVPLLGEVPAASSLITVIVVLFFTTALALCIYRRSFSKISYWV